MTPRAAHHARPPAADSKASVPTPAEQLRALHEALVAYGDKLDYRVDKNQLHPAFAQQRRHAARHGLQAFAVLLRRQGVDVSKALPAEWLAAVERADVGSSTTTDNPPTPTERTAP